MVSSYKDILAGKGGNSSITKKLIQKEAYVFDICSHFPSLNQYTSYN